MISPHTEIAFTIKSTVLLFQKNWADAAGECSKINMHLVAVETVEEQHCLDEIFTSKPNILYQVTSSDHNFLKVKGNQGIANQTYWTGGINKYRQDQFVWATPSRESPVSSQLRITPIASSSTGGDLNCLSYNAKSNLGSTFSVEMCSQGRPYICEVCS